MITLSEALGIPPLDDLEGEALAAAAALLFDGALLAVRGEAGPDFAEWAWWSPFERIALAEARALYYSGEPLDEEEATERARLMTQARCDAYADRLRAEIGEG